MTKLRLVESDFEDLQKRVLPRFPFCYLTFKCEQNNHVFEVRDISHSGMQLVLRNGQHQIAKGASVHGRIHWYGQEEQVTGTVKWATNDRLGMEFSTQQSARESINEFLSMGNFVEHLRPIHKVDTGVELPAKLKYWLRSDGPVELFVWQHSHGDLSHFQFIIMENFVEWVDGEGLKTGRVISKRDVDTPLINEDEFVFKVDNHLDEEKIKAAKDLVSKLGSDKLSEGTLKFLRLILN